MTLILTDHEPADAFVFQFPGSKERHEIPAAEDIITVEAQEQLARGDYSVVLTRLNSDAQARFRKLNLRQLKQFVEAWTGNLGN